MRRIYASRRDALVETLERHFGDGALVLGEAAGMHAYVRFSDTGIGARAERNKVQLREAAPYYRGKPPPSDYLLGFSMLTERALREAVRRLAG
jgi:DNA-binding transcriptional MocR family regulator